jgi:hypothetical protein
MPDSRRYNDEDIQAIIQRALEQQGGGKGELAHADLLAIGEQVGVSAEAMERAAADVIETRQAAAATERVRSSRRRWLAAHAAVFAVINGLLFTVNALTTPGEWWFLFSVVFWGLALAAHSVFALGAGVSAKRQQRERARIEAEKRLRAKPQLRVADTARAAVDDARVGADVAEPRARRGSR